LKAVQNLIIIFLIKIFEYAEPEKPWSKNGWRHWVLKHCVLIWVVNYMLTWVDLV